MIFLKIFKLTLYLILMIQILRMKSKELEEFLFPQIKIFSMKNSMIQKTFKTLK